MSRPVLVSACLLGRACRYDGGSRPVSKDPERDLTRWAQAALGEPARLVPVCPEALGGLGTPRPPAQLVGGDGAAVLAGGARVRRLADGGDVTDAFVAGAHQALGACEGAIAAVLKARSPSCGIGQAPIDGSLARGDGVFAALLRQRGILLWGDESLHSSMSDRTIADSEGSPAEDTALDHSRCEPT